MLRTESGSDRSSVDSEPCHDRHRKLFMKGKPPKKVTNDRLNPQMVVWYTKDFLSYFRKIKVGEYTVPVLFLNCAGSVSKSILKLWYSSFVLLCFMFFHVFHFLSTLVVLELTLHTACLWGCCFSCTSTPTKTKHTKYPNHHHHQTKDGMESSELSASDASDFEDRIRMLVCKLRKRPTKMFGKISWHFCAHRKETNVCFRSSCFAVYTLCIYIYLWLCICIDEVCICLRFNLFSYCFRYWFIHIRLIFGLETLLICIQRQYIDTYIYAQKLVCDMYIYDHICKYLYL